MGTMMTYCELARARVFDTWAELMAMAECPNHHVCEACHHCHSCVAVLVDGAA